MIKDANSLISCFDAGKLLQHGFLLFLTNRYEYRPNHHAVGAHRVALLLISSGRASMLMRHQGAIRETTRAAGGRLKIRLDKKHDTHSVCVSPQSHEGNFRTCSSSSKHGCGQRYRNRAVLPRTPGAVWTLYSV